MIHISALVWDEISKRYYETGISKVVLYPIRNGLYQAGVVWNGITAINEKPSGSEPTPLWADDIKYLNLMSAEDFAATIEAYTYPDEFKPCIGQNEVIPGVVIGRQNRYPFGLCYCTKIGNDTEAVEHGYKLHVVFYCMAAPSEKDYSTVNDSPEAVTMSWEIATNTINVEGYKPIAEIVLDSRRFKKAGILNVLRGFESILYGTSDTDPTIPALSDFQEIYDTYMYLRDSEGELILDSEGDSFLSAVFD